MPNSEKQPNSTERRIFSALHKASRQVEVHLDTEFESMALSAREAHLMGYLCAYAPCPINELMRVFGLKASTLTSMLDRLEKGGYIQRSPNPEDRRSYLLQLSERGRTQAKNAHDRVHQFAAEVMQHLTEEQLQGFEAVMKAINDTTKIELRKKS